jgi:hypothetical protein
VGAAGVGDERLDDPQQVLGKLIETIVDEAKPA